MGAWRADQKEKVACLPDCGGRNRQGVRGLGVAGEAVTDVGLSAKLSDNLLILCAVDKAGVCVV